MPLDDKSIRISFDIDDKPAQARIAELDKSIAQLQRQLTSRTVKRDVISAQLAEARREASELKKTFDEIQAAAPKNNKDEAFVTEFHRAKEAVRQVGAEVDELVAKERKLTHEIDGMATVLKQAENEYTSLAKQQATAASAVMNTGGREDAAAAMEFVKEEIAEIPQTAATATEKMRSTIQYFAESAEYIARTPLRIFRRITGGVEFERREIIDALDDVKAAAEGEWIQDDPAPIAQVNESDVDFVKEKVEELTTAAQESTEAIKMNGYTYVGAMTQAGEAVQNVTGKTNELAAAAQEAGRKAKEAADDTGTSLSKSLSKSLKNVLKWGFGIRSVFILVRRLRSHLVDGVKAFAEYDAATSRSINGIKTAAANLKGSVGALGATIFNAFAPAIQTLIEWLSRGIEAVSKFIALLSGKTSYKKAVAGISSVGAAASAAGEAAKEATKYFSGLDEIRTFEDNNGSSGGGGGGGGSGGGGGLSWVDEQIDAAGVVGKFADYVRENLESVELLLSEFAFVIGMVLAFTGANIPLGLGMMVAGGITGYKNIAANWDAIKTQLQGSMGGVYAIVGGALLAVGAILAFSSANIPLGIGLMAVGAADLATVAVLNWSAIKEKLQGPLGELAAFLGSMAFAMGALLAFSGANIPLGIGIMAAGAASFGVAVAVNWDTIKNKFLEILPTIVTVLSGAMFAVGALFAFTGANLPLGIGMMAVGAAGLFAVAALNWSAIKTKLEAALPAIVAVLSSAVFAIGGILALSGAGLPLGIAMLALGAAGIVSAAALNWDLVRSKLEGPLGKVAAMAGGALLAIGLILAFSGVALPLGIALIAAGAAGLGTAAAVNWNAIKEKISGVFDSIADAYDTWAEDHPIISGILGMIWGTAKKAVSAIALPIELAATGWDNGFFDDLLQKLESGYELVKLFFSDVVAGGLKQIFINIGNSLISIVNSSIASITGALSGTKAGEWFAEKLGLESLDEIRIPLIADLDPPPGTAYNAYKAELEEANKKNPIAAAITGKLDGVKDSLEAAQDSVRSAWESLWSGQGVSVTPTTIPVELTATTLNTDDLPESDKQVGGGFLRAEKMNTDRIPDSQRHINRVLAEAGSTDFTKLTDAQKTVNTKANMTDRNVQPKVSANIDTKANMYDRNVQPKVSANIDTKANMYDRVVQGKTSANIDTKANMYDRVVQGKTSANIDTKANMYDRVVQSKAKADIDTKAKFTTWTPSFSEQPWANAMAWFASTWQNSDNSIQGFDKIAGSDGLWTNARVWFASTWQNSDNSIQGFDNIAGSDGLWANMKAYFNTWQRWTNTSESWNSIDMKAKFTSSDDSLIKGKVVPVKAQFNASGGVFSGGAWHPITQYASGGSPVGGQLFIAREAGPELVGTLKGHTAVMNNDQIVASVSAGVARAIAGIKFYATSSYGPTLEKIGSLLINGFNFFARVPDTLDRIAAGFESLIANGGMPAPAMASGTVVPPGMAAGGGFGDASEAIARLESALTRQEALLRQLVNKPTSFTATTNNRVLFDAMMDEADTRYVRTGRNPFDI